MDKRYQVFVSSTFYDLRQERALVYGTLLRLGCFPVGMEQFPAADTEQIKVIEKLIEQCDYYILIVAGRYGSTMDDGRSFTEAEYDLAVAKGIPVLVFIHEAPAQATSNESDDPEKWALLHRFRDKLQKRGKLNATYTSQADLTMKVMHSITDATRDNPRAGWVKGDRLVSDSAAREILELRGQVEYWKGIAGGFADPGFAKGDDQITLQVFINHGKDVQEMPFDTTWDTLFNWCSDRLFSGTTKSGIEADIDQNIKRALKNLNLLPPTGKVDKNGTPIYPNVSIKAATVEKVIIQFRALDLIERNFEHVWTLTPGGEEKYYRLRAVRKDAAATPQNGSNPQAISK